MAFDSHANFGASLVATAPAPALTGLSLTVSAGEGALFPAAPFNCIVWPSGVAAVSTNTEIIRVTNVVGDVLTIVRAQEGTAARAIVVGDNIANTTTVKVFTDIETSMVQGISAAGGAATGGTVLFDNSPTVTFGRAGQTITASAAGGGGGGITNINLSAGTTSQNLSAVTFSNSNGISFGLDAALSRVTASYTVPTVPAQTTQPVAASASNGSFLFSTVAFSNANGVTFGTSAGSIITASIGAVPGQSTQPVAASASNGSFLFSTLGFSNANNVTFGTSAGSIVTASAHPAQTTQPVAVSASNGSFLFSTLGFSNANGVTFGTSAGSIVTASVGAGAAQTTQPVAASASNGSFLFSTLGFSNANNVTFGTSAGSIVTASAHPAQTTQPVAASASNGSFLFSTLGFSNANGVTFGTSAGSIVTASVGAGAAQTTQPVAASASNGSFLFSTLGFSDANGVTFGTSAGGQITASIATQAPGVQTTFSVFYLSMPPSGYNSAMASNVMSREKYTQFCVFSPITFNQVIFSGSFDNLISTTATTYTANAGITDSVAIFSRSVTNPSATNFSLSNNLVTMFSATQIYSASLSGSSNSLSATYGFNSQSITFTSTGNVADARFRNAMLHTLAMPGSLAIGEYFMGFQASSSSAGYSAASSLLKMSLRMGQLTNAINWAPSFGATTVSTYYPMPGVGSHTATTTAMRTTVALSDITPVSGIEFREFCLSV